MLQPRRGELVKVSALFEKYLLTLKAPQRTVEKAACAAINDVTGLSLKVEQVMYTVSTKTLYINAPAMIRSEIKIRNEEIFTALRMYLGEGEGVGQLL
jgi:hypothetical protein